MVMGMLTNLRWKLWGWASWLAYWLCPDKKALTLIVRVGTENARIALDAAKGEEGKRGQ